MTDELLKDAIRREKEANRAKSDFLSKMSHELRTPLTSVIGFSNLLLKNKQNNLTSKDLTFLQRILDNGKYLLQLINDILDLSKIEAGKFQLEITSVDLRHLAAETAEQLKTQITDKNLKLITKAPEAVNPIRADEFRLKQILFNLLSNAIKFTDKGCVSIRLFTDPETNDPLKIDVSDSGIGIPAERVDAIFEPFQQADTNTAKKFGGTGLGLNISKSLLEQMGFGIKVTSKVGKGSVFSIMFRKNLSN